MESPIENFPDNWITDGWGLGPDGWVELGHAEGVTVVPPALPPQVTIHDVTTKLNALDELERLVMA